MRSITESITRIRTLIRDPRSQTWTDAQIKAYMADAADRIGDALADNPLVAQQLRTCGPVQELVQYQQDYPIPSGCKEVQYMDIRLYMEQYTSLICAVPASVDYTVWAAYTNASFAWYVDGRTVYVYNLSLAGSTSMANVASKIQTAFRAASGGTETISWSTDHFVMYGWTDCGYMTAAPAPGGGSTDLAATMKGTAATGATLSYPAPQYDWFPLMRGAPDVNMGMSVSSISIILPPQGLLGPLDCVRWYPADQPGYVRIWPQPVVTNTLMRLRYLRRPQMPVNDAMGWPGFPDGMDTLVEYYTASQMGYEELQDNKPMIDYAQMFQAKFDSYCSGWGRYDRQQRQYVVRTGGYGLG